MMKDFTADRIRPPIEVNMVTVKHNKIKLREVNRHLVCRLCRGYYIDATTIAECLHSYETPGETKGPHLLMYPPILLGPPPLPPLHSGTQSSEDNLSSKGEKVLTRMLPVSSWYPGYLVSGLVNPFRDRVSEREFRVCRSCIIKYLEKNSFCPICEVQIHKTKPYLNLRLDKALQDVVYKLVPGLYHDEMKRRREFYAKRQEQIPATTPEQCGLEERIIFSPDDSISLSLEYLESDDYETDTVSSKSSESGDNPEGLSFPQQLGLMKLKNGDGKTSRRESQDVQELSFPKRYLQCPAVVSVFHLKKFIRMKHDLTDRMQVDIVHKRVSLPDHYTLMDVAYIYTWKRSAPMRFFYQICETKRQKVKISSSFIKGEETKRTVVKTLEKVLCEKPDLEVGTLGTGDKTNRVTNHKSCAETSSLDKTLLSDVKQTTGIGGPMKSVSENDGKRCETSEKKSQETKANGEVAKEKSNGSDKESEHCDRDKSKAEKTESEDLEGKPEAKKAVKSEGKEKDDEMLLLNPISGQLEPVPSNRTNGKAEVTSAVTGKKELPGETNGKRSFVTESKSRKPVTVNTDEQKEVKKSSVNLLKSFRKEKSTGGAGKETGSKGLENSLTITTVTRSEKQVKGGSDKANVSVEIKSEKKESEYDFDGTSPPSKIIPLQEYSKMAKSQKYGEKPNQNQNNWMSLQDFRVQMLKEGNGLLTSSPSSTSTTSTATTTCSTAACSASGKDDSDRRKDKRKSVPSLFRINTDANKKGSPKTQNGNASPDDKGKPKKLSPTIINIKTENLDSNKTEIKIELPREEDRKSSPKSLMTDNASKELGKKEREEETKKNMEGTKCPSKEKSPEDAVKTDGNQGKDSTKESNKRRSSEKAETDVATKKVKTEEKGKSDSCGAIDLSKAETTPKSSKNPLENLMDMTNKPETPKSDENMVEALISAAQKQSIEPLLKIPHYTQNLKNCSGQGSPPLGKNISSNDISQALQFFKDLRSDIKVLEAKSQLSPNSFLEQFMQKSANLEPIQLYQQHIDLIRRLKRQQQQQMMGSDADSPQQKQAKLSPTSESKRKSSPETTPRGTEEAVQLKSSLERTLSQIQEQMELQSRMVAAQNYKNLPALLQFYNRPPSFCPSPPSPSKSRLKPGSRPSGNSQKSPNSRKSPPNTTSPPGPPPLPLAMTNPEASFFAAQKYNHLINAGLNSEMTFHQMFQNYLNQQDKMNQIKHGSALGKKPQALSAPKSLPDLFYGTGQGTQKKQDRNSVGAAQKT